MSLDSESMSLHDLGLLPKPSDTPEETAKKTKYGQLIKQQNVQLFINMMSVASKPPGTIRF